MFQKILCKCIAILLLEEFIEYYNSNKASWIRIGINICAFVFALIYAFDVRQAFFFYSCISFVSFHAVMYNLLPYKEWKWKMIKIFVGISDFFMTPIMIYVCCSLPYSKKIPDISQYISILMFIAICVLSWCYTFNVLVSKIRLNHKVNIDKAKSKSKVERKTVYITFAAAILTLLAAIFQNQQLFGSLLAFLHLPNK